MPVLSLPSRRSTTPGTPLAFLLPLTLFLGACGVLPGTSSHYQFETATVQDGYDCLATATNFYGRAPTDPASTDPASAKGSVPEDFVPLEAVKCSVDFGGLSETSAPARLKIRQDRFSGDFSALLAALAEPSDVSSGDPCTADMQIVPDLWLVDASGKAVHVQWPLDVCNKTKPGTSQALALLEVRETHFLDGPLQEQEPQPGPQPSATAP